MKGACPLNYASQGHWCIFGTQTHSNMKDTIFQKLKQAYSPLGLGDAILMARAEMLSALGFVTEDNVDDVVAKQKASLEALQKANDTRVTEALAKQAKELAKKHDDEQKAKEEADRKAKEEADRKAAEEKARKEAEEAANKGGLSPELKAYLDKLEETRKSEFEESRKASEKAYQDQISKLLGEVKTLKDENAAAKAAQAKADHQAKILSKAKELNIPQYRIDEGFNIPEDASDETIASYLGTVAKNILTNQLPMGAHHALGDGKVTKEDVEDIASDLVRKL